MNLTVVVRNKNWSKSDVVTCELQLVTRISGIRVRFLTKDLKRIKISISTVPVDLYCVFLFERRRT